jgi:cytochrome c-type biogenesis protein CcmH/NrfG
MQTILKLKGLADEEPENVEAQYHLGLFSWQTGQYDKAMDRFRRTIASGRQRLSGRLRLSRPGLRHLGQHGKGHLPIWRPTRPW